MIGEFAYYEPVGEWLVSRGYDIGKGLGLPRDSYEDRGSPTLRPDKVGIGNLGTKKIEIVSVEIKNGRINYDMIVQASRYFIFSHKVYIASPHKPSPEIANRIKQLGIGFLLINPKSMKITEYVKPQLRALKNRKEMIYWLNNYFKVYECRICGNFVRKDQAKEDSFENRKTNRKLSYNKSRMSKMC